MNLHTLHIRHHAGVPLWTQDIFTTLRAQGNITDETIGTLLEVWPEGNRLLGLWHNHYDDQTYVLWIEEAQYTIDLGRTPEATMRGYPTPTEWYAGRWNTLNTR